MLHPHLPRRTCVLAGPLRWVDPNGHSAVLRVDAAGGRARQLTGRNVTVDLDHARIESAKAGEPLAAGQVVTVRARVPRDCDDPAKLDARRVLTLGPLL